MIKIRTRPINTRPASSIRAALKSGYCMRAQILARSLADGQTNGKANGEFFIYQEGQHRVGPNGQNQKDRGNNRFHLPEGVKIETLPNGKRWSTSSMEIELVKDILEVRDGLGKVVDALVLNKISPK